MSAEATARLTALVYETVLALLSPFITVLQYDSTFNWRFLAATLGLAALVYVFWARGRHLSPIGFLKAFFNKAVWWHRSARADYRYYLVNGILFPVIVGPLILTNAYFGEHVYGGLTQLLGAIQDPILGRVTAMVLFSIVFFLAYDLGRYIAHSLLHDVPLLWQFHKVHHSAEVLTPFTNYRAHPLELFIMAMGANLLTGPVTGVFMYLSGGSVTLYTFFGLHAAIFVYNLMGNLRHTHVWLSYGPLNYVFISPAQHQIHHSALPQHWGRNRGFGLAIWDWMFGTLYAPKHHEQFPMGLGDGTDGQWHTVGRMYWWPLRLAAKSAWSRAPN